MKIQLNTDHNIHGSEALARDVEGRLAGELARFSDQITRIEVHLSDQSGPKSGGDDKRCLIEARMTGLQPVVASHDATTVSLAIDGAIERISHAIATTLAKRDR